MTQGSARTRGLWQALLALALAAPAAGGPNTIGHGNAGVGAVNGSAGSAPLVGDTALVQPDASTLGNALAGARLDSVPLDVLAEGLRQRAPDFARSLEAAQNPELALEATRNLSQDIEKNLQGNVAGHAVRAADLALLSALNAQDPRAALEQLAERFKASPAHQDVAGFLGDLAKAPALSRVAGHLSEFQEALAKAVSSGAEQRFLAETMDQAKAGSGDALAKEAGAVQTLGQAPATPVERGLRTGDAEAAQVARAEGVPVPAASVGKETSRFAGAISDAAKSVWKTLREQSSHLGVYVGLIGVTLLAQWQILSWGQGLGPSTAAASTAQATHAVGATLGPTGLLGIPLVLMGLQVAAIIGAARFFSKLLSKIGQPPVIGEIIGGLALGPSLLGAIWPAGMAALFPAESLSILRHLSEIGLVAFMFTVGLEIDPKALKDKAGAALLISHTSIAVPFILGSALALVLFTGFAPAGVPFLAFSLFMGVAMSITAFPVLARILHDRGITKTPLGNVALTSAAIDDVSAWGLLAVVLGIAGSGSALAGLHVLGLALIYVGAMLGVVRPLLKRWLNFVGKGAASRWLQTAAIAGVVALSALATHWIGIHALFGAFVAGAIMPKEAGVEERFTGRFQTWTSRLLLPIFFALTGLRTQIGMLGEPYLLAMAGLILAVATVGKVGGSTAAARFAGMRWRDSFSIGALMNTRGLMELVVLNIALDMGIISAPLFTMLVFMAVATTFMTGPVLSWLTKGVPREAAEPKAHA